MSKLLFVTSRNILETSGEMRLIKNRAKVIEEKYNLKSDFIALRVSKKIQRAESITENGLLKVFSFNGKNYFDYLKKQKECFQYILNLIKSNDYKVVVVSGFLVLDSVKIIKTAFPNLPVIIDVHGAIEELIEFRFKNMFKQIKRSFNYKFLKRQEKKNFKYGDVFFIVSNKLKDYLIKEYKVGDKEFIIAPCSVNQKEIDEDKYIENRSFYRAKYNIGDNEKLLIYSGGTSPWQCINETIKIYRNIRSKIGSSIRLLILTPNIDYIKSLSLESEILVDSLAFSEVTKVLCAGDFGMLIRQNKITNNVAYPNKFLEYVSSGLSVITTPYISDVAKQTNDFNVGFIINGEEEVSNKLIEYIENYDCGDINWQNRKNLLDKVSFYTTLDNISFFKKS